MSDGSLRMTRDAYIPAIVSGPYCSGWSMAGIQVTAATVPGFSIFGGSGAARTITVSGLSSVDAGVVLTQLAAPPGTPNSIAMCYQFARGTVSSPTSLTFTRGGGILFGTCDNYSSGDISYQRVDFGPRASVQQHLVTIPHALATQTVTLNPAVDPSRTLVFFSGMTTSGLATGETGDRASGNDRINHVVATAALLSGNQVLVSRQEALEPAQYTLFVVEFR